MKKSFLNILLGTVLLFVLIGFFVSCEIPRDRSGLITGLNLTDNEDNNTRDDRDDDDDDDDEEICDNRDSCQDSCDYMFKRSSSRRECYDLSFDDVNELEQVFDELSSANLDKRKLQRIDEDSFREFLNISPEGWLHLIDGTNKVKSDGYTREEAKVALEWVAEDESIAETISDYDSDQDILYELFVTHGGDVDAIGLHFETIHNNAILWKSDALVFGKSGSSSVNVKMDGIGKVLEFLVSYMGLDKTGLAAGTNSDDFSFNDESFIQYADEERNTTAVDLAHDALVDFCVTATDEDETDSDNVKQCLLAVYCSIKTPGFSERSSISSSGYSPSLGDVASSFDNFLQGSQFDLDNSGSDMCNYNTLTDDDKFQRYF